MADESPLAGLLDRAGNVFTLAGKLGEAFHAERLSPRRLPAPSIWQRHAPAFNEYCAALLDLREAMQNPPDGFAPIAERLLQAAKLAKGIRDTLVSDDGFPAYLDFFPDLNTVCQAGREAVKEVTKARRLDDPFTFVDKPAIAPAYSLLDRFPATPAGHIAFLEWVYLEVREQANALRAGKYPHESIARQLRNGVRWAEARQRLSALPGLPPEMRAKAHDVFRRELTIGTVEQIDALLQPVVWGLRDCFEQARFADQESKLVVVTTAGDLWKAYTEGKRPYFETSSISLQPGANTAAITCPNDADEANRTTLDRAQALVTAEGGDKAAAMEKLIARVQLQAGMDKTSVINMPLAEFVAAAMGRGTPPSLEAIAQWRAKEQAKAADRELNEMHARDWLEAAWQRIYVSFPMVGDPTDYARWEANIVAFAEAAAKTGKAELFLNGRVTSDDERKALSLIQAALTGGAAATRSRLLELEANADDPSWKKVFNSNTLFWRILQPERFAVTQSPIPPDQPSESASDSVPHAIAKRGAEKNEVQSEPTDAPGAATPKRRGRKKADYKTVQNEAAIAAEWERARDSGVYKAAFAKDKNMTNTHLKLLLDRVAKRKRASE